MQENLNNMKVSQYRPYELVTAMTIFKKYGRGEKLLEYFSDDEKTPHAKNWQKQSNWQQIQSNFVM